MNIYSAVSFIKSNARPLERAIYNCFFEEGNSDDLLEELAKYQNPDGGFGNGLEPDNWNPNSNPIATNDAIITLYRTGTLNKADKIVSGIVRYLQSHDSFDEEQKRWLFAIESNKDYPHAIWWEKEESGISGFNPTISLAAFMVCFGERMPFYEKIIEEGYNYLRDTNDVSGDELKCFLLCYKLLVIHNITNIVDLTDLKRLIIERIEYSICKDIDRYGKEYVTTPSDFFAGCYSDFISDGIRELILAEINILPGLQKADGGFDITWQWYTPYPEFEQARRWWRPRITIDKLLFYKEHCDK